MSLTKFPKNLLKLKDPRVFRDYCLNPLGLKPTTTSNFPRPQRVENFLNIPLQLHRAEKPLEKNTFVLKVPLNLTKPEIKQYLTKVYGLEVEKVNTLIQMGKIKRGAFGKRYRAADFKKAYVDLKTEVPEFFQKVENI